MFRQVRVSGWAILLLYGTSTLGNARGSEGKILSPLPYQVVQREGFDPDRAHEHQPGGPALGHGHLPITVEWSEPLPSRFEYRVVRRGEGTGTGTEWAALEVARSDRTIKAMADVPAGGWYRLELRGLEGTHVIGTTAVEPVGVGEVFIIAGQSYAAGTNDGLLRVEDAEGQVVALDLVAKRWRVAHDPQPAVGDGGTIWPAFGDALRPLVRVPIGLVNVAVGGTSSRQWLPGTPLYRNLETAGKAVGRFRAVLWQQGESDVIEKVAIETYVANLRTIRAGLSQAWGFEPPWLLAKSTLHPTVYNDPTHEGMIRSAIDRLWRTEGFRPGPDTDILGGENRGGPNSRRHFSEVGQRRAGLLWFAAVWAELQGSVPLQGVR
ncbi:hypothetical protein SAMN05444166_5305 [Singulisphaera sp. GP187]|uniref:sialate O-acetylesterase n=1 Tax=Singulisphaera sp. GP187 TaxID=1882752 RepID=UPI00092CD89E|nr:sialate O-acetylesterase [Singulisphaera sp. GP187]SIO56855.1 hypothetical protein SAMN05444166_5305 [Singulisphaera sp. GP187]